MGGRRSGRGAEGGPWRRRGVGIVGSEAVFVFLQGLPAGFVTRELSWRASFRFGPSTQWGGVPLGGRDHEKYGATMAKLWTVRVIVIAVRGVLDPPATRGASPAMVVRSVGTPDPP